MEKEKKFVGEDLLDAFVKITPYIKKLIPIDIYITVADTQKYLAYQSLENINLGIKVGEQIQEGRSIHKIMTERKGQVVIMPKERYGIPYKGIAEPIFDEDDNVIGAVAMGVSLQNQNRLQEIIEQYSTGFQHVNSNVQGISASAQNIAKIAERLSTVSGKTKENIQKTDEIVQMIRHISEQTKMLGINAAIEAARVGENGRGFSVVAEEIRRLSEQSNISAKQAANTLREIAAYIDSINNESQETSSVSQEQAASTEDIAASMQELCAQLEALTEFVKLV